MLKKNDVVQFNENHKWRGCFGFINEIKDCGDNGIRYMVGVPIPIQGTVYIFVMNTENAIEKIGEAILVLENDE
jgi:hypothetical protein